MQVKLFKPLLHAETHTPFTKGFILKYLIFSIILQCLMIGSCAQAMLEVESEISSDFLEVTDIKPFGAPFTHVPRIVFANPPHRILKLTDESCAAIRKAAQNVTPEQIRNSVQKQNPALPLSSDAFGLKCLETAESYDWMNAMNYINEHLQDTELDISFVKELNRRLGRLSTVNSGRFRQDPAKWNLYSLDNTEGIFWHYIDRNAKYVNIFRNLEYWVLHTKQFCESVNGLLDDQDRYLRVEKRRYVETESIQRLLTALSDRRTALVEQETGQPYEIDIYAAKAWELDEKETNDEYKAGYIDLVHWKRKRMYDFCMPDELEVRLRESIRANSRSTLHPIEQAAHIWLEIVRIHPFNDAHKRTGKAIATFILLKHGYLPPLLRNDDVEECLKMLIANVDPRRGYRHFTQYLARLVKRTQDQYESQIV